MTSLTAVPAGFADVDGDALTYTYQWSRNGTAIAGATGRTLDLALAGNGDLGDTIAVDVTGVDTSGATSAAARAQQNVTGTNSTPVEGTVALSPASPKTTETVTAAPAGFRDPDGDALTYRYQWFRNGTAIPGATAAALNLSAAGAGDRGDALKVEVSRRTPLGESDKDPAVDDDDDRDHPPRPRHRVSGSPRARDQGLPSPHGDRLHRPRRRRPQLPLPVVPKRVRDRWGQRPHPRPVPAGQR